MRKTRQLLGMGIGVTLFDYVFCSLRISSREGEFFTVWGCSLFGKIHRLWVSRPTVRLQLMPKQLFIATSITLLYPS